MRGPVQAVNKPAVPDYSNALDKVWASHALQARLSRRLRSPVLKAIDAGVRLAGLD